MEQEQLFLHFRTFIFIYLDTHETAEQIKLIEAYEKPLNDEEKARFILFENVFNKEYTKQLNKALNREKKKEMDKDELEAIILDSFNRSKLKEEKEFKPQGATQNEI